MVFDTRHAQFDSPLTPCIGICRMDAAGLCVGCRRTLDEIARWGVMSDAERLRCMTEVLPGRQESSSHRP